MQRHHADNTNCIATMVSIKDQDRMVSLILKLKYSLNSQNPASFILRARPTPKFWSVAAIESKAS